MPTMAYAITCKWSRQLSIVVNEFLALLEAVIAAHPEVIKQFSQDLAERITALTADISISLTDEIEGVVSL